MPVPLTKAGLLAELTSARDDWNRMLNTAGSTPIPEGSWPLKSVIFHATRYADLFVQALEAHLRGEPPPPEVLARPDTDERNAIHFRQSEARTLEEVVAESRKVFDRLILLIQCEGEVFLIDPQSFDGFPEPVHVGEGLLHVGLHYRSHLADLIARTGTGGEPSL